MKTVLITGANRGIGLEHVRSFAAKGWQVFATARSPSDADELNALAKSHAGRFKVFAYDAVDSESAIALKSSLGDSPIDVLLANAGASTEKSQTFGSVDVDDTLNLIRVNSIAPIKLAEALAGNVARSERKVIAFQSSQLGSIGNSSGGRYAYRISKAALNMAAKCVAADLGSRGVIVVALHPGWVKTRMGGSSAPLTVEQSVAGQPVRQQFGMHR